MATLNHTHTWRRHETRPLYMRCAHPKCYSIEERSILVGKLSCCNLCGKEFTLTREDLRRTMPRCLDCSNTAKAKQVRASMAIAKMAFTALPDELISDSDEEDS